MDWNCKYCGFVCKSRSRIFSHYTVQHFHHARRSQFPCVYKDCLQTFRKVKSLSSHLTRFHDVKNSTTFLQLKCVDCTATVSSLKDFFRHQRRHIDTNEFVGCPYAHCAFRSKVKTTYTAHISRQHKNEGVEYLSKDIAVGSTDLSNHSTGRCQSEHDQVDVDTDVDDDVGEGCTWTSGGNELNAYDLIERELSRLFLKMHVLLHVPQYAIDEIISGLSHVHLLSKQVLNAHIRQVFVECNLDEAVADRVTECVTNEYPFHKLTNHESKDNCGLLSTKKLRDTFVKTTLPYVKPVQYEFGYNGCGKYCNFVYVPILHSIQELLKRPDILEKLMHIPPSADGMYQSFLDGSLYSNHRQDDSLHLHISLYTDEWETVNPLGTSRKVHKVSAFYWIFTMLEQKYSSVLHVTQLACMARHVDVKEFGLSKFLHPLLSDLSFLETNGVYIEALGASVKGSVTAVIADNLSAHALGGFNESFGPNVGYPCRFCTAHADEIQSVELSVCDFTRRSVEEHNMHINAKKSDPGINSVFGVKNDCILHSYLKSFHAATSLPPCLAHDLLEGIVSSDLALSLQVFISKQYFDLKWLNDIIKTFPYKFSDSVNKPQRIPDTFAASGTIGGNASENWTLLRLLPVLVGSKVPRDDPTWDFLMDLKDIWELCFAPVISHTGIDYLAAKITEHRRSFKCLFPDKKFRPKHHFVAHYPDLIKQFGTLCNMWTMRFESKHGYFKRVVQESHCFKNVLLTMAEKHQLLMAYHLSAPTYFTPDTFVPESPQMAVDVLSEKCQQAIHVVADSAVSVSIAPFVRSHGTKYCPGMIVVIGHSCGLPVFGEVVSIVLVLGKLFLLISECDSWYCEHIRGYIIQRREEMRMLEPGHLYDYYPLAPYEFEGEVCVMLKHFIDVCQ